MLAVFGVEASLDLLLALPGWTAFRQKLSNTKSTGRQCQTHVWGRVQAVGVDHHRGRIGLGTEDRPESERAADIDLSTGRTHAESRPWSKKKLTKLNSNWCSWDHRSCTGLPNNGEGSKVRHMQSTEEEAEWTEGRRSCCLCPSSSRPDAS